MPICTECGLGVPPTFSTCPGCGRDLDLQDGPKPWAASPRQAEAPVEPSVQVVRPARPDPEPELRAPEPVEQPIPQSVRTPTEPVQEALTPIKRPPRSRPATPPKPRPAVQATTGSTALAPFVEELDPEFAITLDEPASARPKKKSAELRTIDREETNHAGSKRELLEDLIEMVEEEADETADVSLEPPRRPARRPRTERVLAVNGHSPVGSETEAPAVEWTNTSGAGRDAVVPREIVQWNWGAFLLSGFWSLANRVPLGIASLLVGLSSLGLSVAGPDNPAVVAYGLVSSVFGLTVAVLVGAKGNEWSWRNKRWADVETFKRKQLGWRNSAIAVYLLCGGLAVLAMSVLMVRSFDSPATDGAATPTQMLTSASRSVSVSVPAGWSKVRASGDTDIAAVNRAKNETLQVVAENKPDSAPGLTLDRFASEAARQVAHRAGIPLDGLPIPVDVGGQHAIRYELAGSIDGESVTIIHLTVETSNQLIQVITAGPSAAVNQDRATLDAILYSVQAP